MSYLKHRVIGVTLLGLVAVCVDCERHVALPSPEPVDVRFDVEDGGQVTATLYPCRTNASPSLVLVPPPGSDGQAWAVFATRAQREGMACLAINVAEFVTADRGTPTNEPSKDGWRRMVFQVLLAAKNYLVARGAKPDNLAMAGADAGANIVLAYAARDPDVQAVVLVSPWLDYHGLKATEDILVFGKRPSLLVTTEGDAYSASACATLKRTAPGFCELREFPGSAHGTDVFAASVNAAEQSVYWLTTVIGPEKQQTAPLETP